MTDLGITPLGSHLPDGWELRKLGDLCAKIGSGATPKGGSAVYVPTGFSFIRSQNVYDHKFSTTGLAHIDKEAAHRLSGAKVREGDVLLNITGDGETIARCCVVPDGVLPARVNQHVLILRSNGGILPEFLQRHLSHPSMRSYMLSHSAGGSRRALTKAQAEKFLVAVPPISVQQSIVTVLRALDDRIAVNERIAAAALDLADAQFSGASQGVDFGPETFGSTAAVVGGGTPSTKTEDYWGGGIAWTTPTDVTALSAPYLFETGRTITATGLENCASRLYPVQSIFMTSRATIGAFALPQMPAAVNQGFIVVLPPTDELRWWLFHEMRSRVDEMISLANGSTFLELSRKNFKAMPIRLAANSAIFEFAQNVAPLHSRAAQATAESRTLATLRDTLLRQLMSGKLRVREAEKIVEDAV